jgi:N-acetylmuramoyl-L-alanine amidase
MADLSPKAGREIVIPGHLLQAPFARRAAQSAPRGRPDADPEADAAAGEGTADDFAEIPPDADPHAGGPGTDPVPLQAGLAAPPPVAEGAEDLEYGSDAQGRYAAYPLKRGEALYSAVVMRFTGRIDAQEVNDLAAVIAARSGVEDVTNIPIGHPIRVPLETLLPEYLPRDDPRRLAWEKHETAVARETNPVQSRNLKGIAVILDAGHGGEDRGAAHNGVWEHDYVYDILCRLKARLERETGARVLTTIKDRKEGYAVQDLTRLRRSQAEVLLTDPPFPLRAGAASVNLRWYLTNSYARRLVAEGYDPLRIVFISLHADARHPSLGGAMVYIAGEEYRRGRYGYQGAIYTRHSQVREQPYVSFTPRERRQSEGLSRQFARSLVGAFRQHDVDVHPHGPVRERIVRRGRSWVPAVLRCSEVPVQALVEVSNLSNPADSRKIATPVYRQQVADALYDGLHRYYGERLPRPPVAAATAGRR